MKNEIYKILICPICGQNLNEKLYCTKCHLKYKNKRQEILNLCQPLEPHKEHIASLYDKMSLKKCKTTLSRFSVHLNYGIKFDEDNGHSLQSSLEQIKFINEGINYNDTRILDIGCGRGGNLFYIHSQFKPKYMVGIDLSIENIKFCMSKRSEIYFIQADAEKLPFADSSFDFVINIESSSHYLDMCKFFCEVARVLSEGGIFLFTDIIDSSSEYSLKEYLNMHNLFIVKESNYTQYVLQSMQSKGLDKPNNDTVLFDHFSTYNSLLIGEKKYILWKIRKGGNNEIDMC